jgi:hypothetical protein
MISRQPGDLVTPCPVALLAADKQPLDALVGAKLVIAKLDRLSRDVLSEEQRGLRSQRAHSGELRCESE